MGEAGFVGVSPRIGGGDIQTPVLPFAADVQAWIDSRAAPLAEAANAPGRASEDFKICHDDPRYMAPGLCPGELKASHIVLSSTP
jgi:hypothetical protein